MTGKRRPHRSNPPSFPIRLASINEVLRPPPKQKRIYWTEAKLRRVMISLVKPDRERWFAARLKELRSWPERSSEEIMEAATRIRPRRLLHGRWAWPKRELAIQQDLQSSAPERGIDLIKLRGVLSQMDNRAGDQLIKMLVESGLLQESTMPLDNGLPQPTELSTGVLRRIRKASAKLKRDLAGDSDGDIALCRPTEVPRANLQSPSWFESHSPVRVRKGLLSGASE
jgi:hypothetical protein